MVLSLTRKVLRWTVGFPLMWVTALVGAAMFYFLPMWLIDEFMSDNLIIVKGWPPRPTRVCRNRTGRPETHQLTAATTAMSGASRTTRTIAKPTSKVRLPKALTLPRGSGTTSMSGMS